MKVTPIASAVLLGTALRLAAGPTGATLIHCAIELDREVLPAGDAQTAVLKIRLDAPLPPAGLRRPPVNVALVLDRSGSMSGSKIENARRAAIEALRRLGGQDLFSVVIFDHEVETLVPAQSAQYTEAVESRIRGVTARGNTAIFGGVSQGAAEIRKNLGGRHVHRVILLSDGLANVGPSAPADLARLGAALLKEGISVTTIGVGTDFNEDLMTQLAQASDGNHYFVESDADLPRIFARELGEVLNVVARRVVLEIECPNGARPLRIIGREGRIVGNRVELHLNQLYGGQGKYALVEVELPPARDAEVLEIAVVNCSYENPFTNRPEQASARAHARFSSDQAAVQGSANPAVQEALTLNEMAVARDQALDLYKSGQPQAAAAVLRTRGEELKARNVGYGLDGIAGQTDALREDADRFEAEQVDERSKKEIRAGSFKTRTQQQ